MFFYVVTHHQGTRYTVCICIVCVLHFHDECVPPLSSPVFILRWLFSGAKSCRVLPDVQRGTAALQLSVHFDLVQTRPSSLPPEFFLFLSPFSLSLSLLFLRFLFPVHLSGCLCGCFIQSVVQ